MINQLPPQYINSFDNLNTAWKKAEPMEFKPLPEGNYQATITDVKLQTTKGEKPEPVISIELTVNSPYDYQGRKTFVSYYPENEASLGSFKGLIRKVNEVVADNSQSFSDVVLFALNNLQGKSFDIQRKNSTAKKASPDGTFKIYENTYINEMLFDGSFDNLPNTPF